MSNVEIDARLEQLCQRAWQAHRDATRGPWLVQPSAPVLFFGNLGAFKRSQLRVTTVGLNPSRQEFPSEEPFRRFPGAKSDKMAEYIASLANYFEHKPYNWFAHYDKVLAGLDASYYLGKPNRALHTDIGSVLATDPTWNRLDRSTQDGFGRVGIGLWHSLIEFLEPQIVLWSTAAKWFDHITFFELSPWTYLCQFRETKDGRGRAMPYIIDGRWYRLPSGGPMLVARCPAANTPLGTLAYQQRTEAGAAILAAYRRYLSSYE